MENANCRAREELFNFFLRRNRYLTWVNMDCRQSRNVSLAQHLSVVAAGAMHIDPSRVEFRKAISRWRNAARFVSYSVLRRNLRYARTSRTSEARNPSPF